MPRAQRGGCEISKSPFLYYSKRKSACGGLGSKADKEKSELGNVEGRVAYEQDSHTGDSHSEDEAEERGKFLHFPVNAPGEKLNEQHCKRPTSRLLGTALVNVKHQNCPQ